MKRTHLTRYLSLLLCVLLIFPSTLVHAHAIRNSGTPLVELDVIQDTIDNHNSTGIEVGTWRDTEGNKYNDALRFSVVYKDDTETKTYSRIEYIDYQLGKRYETLSGTIACGAGSEQDAIMSIAIWIDGQEIYKEEITYYDVFPFYVNVEDAKVMRIVCTTSTDDYGYCIVSGTFDHDGTTAQETAKTELQVEAKPSVISAGTYHSVYIYEDGTVAATGKTSDSRCEVENWTDIISVSASSHTVGLDAYGNVFAVGPNTGGKCEVDSWVDITDIDAGENNTICVNKYGEVEVAGNNKKGQGNVSQWKDVYDVEMGANTSYGLKTNGTVVAAGSNASGQKNVGTWSDIVAISAGRDHVVGLKNDGTVVAVGNNANGQCDVSKWKNIVAISAGNSHTVGLRADGTVVATGSNNRGQCDVAKWKDIVAISAGAMHTLGVRSDGTMVSVGNNGYGQCNVS